MPSRFLNALDPRRRRNRSTSTGERSDISDASDRASADIVATQSPPAAASPNAGPAQLLEAADQSFAPTSDDAASSGGDRPSQAEINISVHIWNKAYDRLKQGSPEVVVIYEKILSSRMTTSAVAQVTLMVVNRFANCSPDVRLARMNDVTRKALEKIQQHETLENEVVAAVDILKSLCGFVSGFVSAYPPAGMALSGISTALPILVKPLQSNRDMAGGLKHVIERFQWYMDLCQLLLRERWPDDQEFHRWSNTLKERVTKLYGKLLEFEMKSVCQCFHEHPVAVGLRVMLGRLNWKSEIDSIKALETAITGDIQAYNLQTGIEYLRSIKVSSQNLASQLGKYFEGETEARRAWQEEERQNYQSRLTGEFKSTPYDERMELNSVRIEGTCQWFCKHEALRRWLDTDSSRILLVSADPGCGKSVLASYLVKTVLPMQKPEATVCYFFFKDNPEQSELSNAYSAVLHCLFYNNGHLADYCKHSIQRHGPSLTNQSLALWNVFSEAVTSKMCGPVICVLDALDECKAEGLAALIANLKTLYSTYWGPFVEVQAKFLLTTRGYPQILDQFKSLAPYCIQLAGENENEVREIQKEIDLVVNARLDKLSATKDFSKEQKLKLKSCLKRHGKEQRTYLWAKLVFEVLEGAYPDDSDMWEELVSNLPRTVSSAYAKLLERVLPENQERVLVLLRTILAAYRPLSLLEMKIALRVRDRPGSVSIESLNMISDKSFRDWIINTCGFFVTEYGGKVYLIHQTAKEFLVGQASEPPLPVAQAGSKIIPIDEQKKWKPAVSLRAAHAAMAESCISYLSLGACRTGSIREAFSESIKPASRGQRTTYPALSTPTDGADDVDPFESHPFAEYVIRYWPAHFRHGQLFQDDRLVGDIGEKYWPHYNDIFEDALTKKHPGILATLEKQTFADIWVEPEASNADQSTLGIGPWLLAYAVGLKITKDPEISLDYSEDFRVATLCAFWGHVKLLQSKLAAQAANESSLLGRLSSWVPNLGTASSPQATSDCNPHRLVLAAVAGKSVPCLQCLVLRDDSFISRIWPSVTSTSGLLSAYDDRGRSPLHLAAMLGHADVAKCLLDNGAAIDVLGREDYAGLTPLQTALDILSFDAARDAVARLLVARGANLAVKTTYDSTPLHMAACILHGIKLSSGQSRARPNDDSSSHQLEAKYQSSLIKLMVDHGAPIEAVDKARQTPLHIACIKRETLNAAHLLRSGANPDARNAIGDTPLLAVIRLGRDPVGIVTLLLRHGAAPDDRSKFGHTPLHLVCGAEGAECWGASPLAAALLRAGADVHARSTGLVDRNRSPLQLAMRKERNEMRELTVVQLLAAGADVHETGLDGRTALHRACATRDSFLVRRLLDSGADPRAKDARGDTPLHLLVEEKTVEWGDEPWIEKAVRLLLLDGRASVSMANERGVSPHDIVMNNGWAWLAREVPEFQWEGWGSWQDGGQGRPRGLPPNALQRLLLRPRSLSASNTGDSGWPEWSETRSMV